VVTQFGSLVFQQQQKSDFPDVSYGFQANKLPRLNFAVTVTAAKRHGSILVLLSILNMITVSWQLLEAGSSDQ